MTTDEPSEPPFIGDEAEGLFPGVTYLSGAQRSSRVTDAERVQSGARVIDQAEHAEWRMNAEGRIRLHLSAGGREEIAATFGSDTRGIRRITIQRFYTETGRPGQDSLSFDASEAVQVVKLFEDIAQGAIESTDTTVVDNTVLEAFKKDRSALRRLYERGGKEQLEALIESDVTARDIVATAGRRTQLEEFEKRLADPDHFAEQAVAASGPEKAWQQFFEANPWIFGLGLTHTFLQSWDEERLEKTTTGGSVIGPGKRVDALLETTGYVRSLCFTEIKGHTAPLLQATANRPGVWAPSRQLVEAVAQIQRTVDEATRTIGQYLEAQDADEFLTGQRSHLVYPRSFLVIGSLKELTAGERGRESVSKVRSFELYRGSLAYPEIVTYDELLARARFIVGEDPSSSEDTPGHGV